MVPLCLLRVGCDLGGAKRKAVWMCVLIRELFDLLQIGGRG